MILQVINSLNIGGAEKFVSELVLQLKREGKEVEVMVIDDTESYFSELLLQQGIVIRRTLSSKYLSPLNLFTFIWIFLGNRYDVIHTHLTYAQLWVALASLLNVRGKKLFTSEHSNENNRRGNKLLKIADKFIYSRYRKVLCISETTRRSLLEWIVPQDKDKYIVVPNCVDIAKFRDAAPSQRNEFGLADDDKIVMMVGRMSEAKDQKTIIRAIENLPQEYKCVLVGGGETLQKLRQSVPDDSRIIFTGVRTDIAELVNMCDIYVQSSNWEGLPTTVLEAMAAGKVVLGSNVRGIVDIVPAGQLFENGNDMQLADMIIQLDQTKKNQIIARQNKTVEQYSLQKITCDVQAQYNA